MAAQSFPRANAFYEYRDRTFGVRRGMWKLLRYPDARGWVLTDLSADPEEYNNLWDHPSATTAQGQLKDDLLRWLADTPRYALPQTSYW
jgi:hypothetical protein